MTAAPSPARLGVGGAAPLPPLLRMPVDVLVGARLGGPPRLAARARVASECRPSAQSTPANQGCCRTSSAPACAPRRWVGSCKQWTAVGTRRPVNRCLPAVPALPCPHSCPTLAAFHRLPLPKYTPHPPHLDQQLADQVPALRRHPSVREVRLPLDDVVKGGVAPGSSARRRGNGGGAAAAAVASGHHAWHDRWMRVHRVQLRPAKCCMGATTAKPGVGRGAMHQRTPPGLPSTEQQIVFQNNTGACSLEGCGAIHQLVQQDAKGPPVNHAVVACSQGGTRRDTCLLGACTDLRGLAGGAGSAHGAAAQGAQSAGPPSARGSSASPAPMNNRQGPLTLANDDFGCQVLLRPHQRVGSHAGLCSQQHGAGRAAARPQARGACSQHGVAAAAAPTGAARWGAGHGNRGGCRGGRYQLWCHAGAAGTAGKRQVEVGELAVAGGHDQDVLRLQVPVSSGGEEGRWWVGG